MLSMRRQPARFALRRLMPWGAAAIFLFQGGCFLRDVRGPGYRDELQPLGQQMRPDAADHDYWGFDQRSRQTEENLGK